MMKPSLLVLLVMVACGGGGDADAGLAHDGAPHDGASTDASTDAGLLERCAQMQDQFPAALAQVSTSCNDVSDCAIVGAQTWGTCDCAPAVGACSGTAVNAAAFHASQAETIEAAFAQDCGNPFDVCGSGTVECICDCAPAQNLRCSNHHCVADEWSCLEPPPGPDAGVADAGPDATP